MTNIAKSSLIAEREMTDIFKCSEKSPSSSKKSGHETIQKIALDAVPSENSGNDFQSPRALDMNAKELNFDTQFLKKVSNTPTISREKLVVEEVQDTPAEEVAEKTDAKEVAQKKISTPDESIHRVGFLALAIGLEFLAPDYVKMSTLAKVAAVSCAYYGLKTVLTKQVSDLRKCVAGGMLAATSATLHPIGVKIRDAAFIAFVFDTFANSGGCLLGFEKNVNVSKA